ncbi:uncharacterized protein [Nicotiana tomentosiformis]|uniref:uncharacterized protein n=1 Tax=Nicotiana tomentosiformis TaxID=4098 RepID=UPI00388C95B5
MHNATAANFLASEGLHGLIHKKEEITSAQDQLLAEQEQHVARLSELEANVVEAVVLEARLRQREQRVVTRSQEIRPLRVRFDEFRAKLVEVHNAILDAIEREAASAERVIKLEGALNSKIEELASMGAKYAQLEEKYRKTIEHNRLFSSTENLSAGVTQLKEELKRRAASLVVEKTYSMYSIRRKTLEEAKAGVIDFDTEIAKACELELAAKSGLPARSDARGPSGSSSEFSATEEALEANNAEGQTGENVKPLVGPSTSPGVAYTSLPPGSGDTAV